MLPGQMSFPGIPGPPVLEPPAPMMPARELVSLLATLPPYRPSSPEEIRARIEQRRNERMK